MANLENAKDLIEDALRKSGEKIDGTSKYEDDALLYMNNFYKKFLAGSNEFDVDLGDPWAWAKSPNPATLVLQPPYTTGSVSLTSGSTSGSFSSAPASSLTGYLLKLDNYPEFYRIASHTAASTAFVIDCAFTEASVGGVTYQAIKLDYDLIPGVLRLVSPMTVYRTQDIDSDYEGKIYALDLTTMSKDYPLSRLNSGTPTKLAILREADGLFTVRFNFAVAVQTKVEYEYIPFPTPLARSTNSLPIIPSMFRQVLSYATAWQICTEKEDDKAQTWYTLTKANLIALAKHTHKQQSQSGQGYGQLIPRRDNLRIKKWPILG